MNRAEFPMFFSLRHEYAETIRAVDGVLTAAARLHQHSDPERAATIEAFRIVAMRTLRELADLIASVEERKSS